MKYCLFLLICILLNYHSALGQVDSVAAAPSAAQRRAAESLLRSTKIDQLLEKTIASALDAQMAQNEKLRDYRSVMEAFFGRYMSWKALKEPMIDIYARAFSKQELMEIEAFYRTPVGQKALLEMPSLERVMHSCAKFGDASSKWLSERCVG